MNHKNQLSCIQD